MAKFRHRKMNQEKIEFVAKVLATEIIGPEPDNTALAAQAQRVLDQLPEILDACQAHFVWNELPEDFRKSITDGELGKDYYCDSYWRNEAKLSVWEIFMEMDSKDYIDGIGNYHIDQAMEKLGVSVPSTTKNHGYLDWYYITPKALVRAEQNNKFIAPYIDSSIYDDLHKHVLHKAIDHNTIVQNDDGQEVTLYAALSPLCCRAMQWTVNLEKLKSKLRNEMHDCTTKQVIEAWPEAEQIIYDVYGYQPNVSKPTNPLSQVIADAGILQIAAQ